MEEPIGSRELSYELPPSQPPEGIEGTNQWGKTTVNRMQLTICLAALFAVMLVIMVGYGHDTAGKLTAKEEADIAAVRSEQQAATKQILDAQSKQARAVNANLNQLIGTVNTLVKEIVQAKKAQP